MLGDKFETERFGLVTVDNEIHFAKGLVGFPELTNFTLLAHAPDSAFYWLQSLDDAAFAFVLIHQSNAVKSNKSINLLENLTGQVYYVVRVPLDPKKMTVNLRAPLIIDGGTGYQHVQDGVELSTKEPLIYKGVSA